MLKKRSLGTSIILYPAASAAQGCTAVFRAQKGNIYAFFDDL